MHCEPPDKHFFTEIRDLNLEFLALIADPHGGEAAVQLLGFSAPAAAQLRRLSDEERGFVAGVPGLLAGFRRLPARFGVADAAPMGGLDSDWLGSATVFSAALMTYLWQVAQRDRLLTALCVGPDSETRRELRAITFRDIQSGAFCAVGQLRARLGRHPHWWQDLLNAARSRDEAYRERCRLDLIALSLGRSVRPAEHSRQWQACSDFPDPVLLAPRADTRSGTIWIAETAHAQFAAMFALSLRQLTKVYANGAQALKGVDLDVEDGDFFALLGPNGAGKTTAIGIVTSLVNKTAGDVSIFGHSIDDRTCGGQGLHRRRPAGDQSQPVRPGRQDRNGPGGLLRHGPARGRGDGPRSAWSSCSSGIAATILRATCPAA